MSALFAMRPGAGSASGFCSLADVVYAASALRQGFGWWRIWCALVVLGMSWLGACSNAGAPFCEGDPPRANAANGYLLGPGDRVRVTVFRQPDLSGEFTTDGEGYIALPLVGEILAAGLSTRQLEAEIAERLEAGGFLVDPQVTVQLLTYRPIDVLGEVNRPGSYEFREGMTATNAVALAGGYTGRARPVGDDD